MNRRDFFKLAALTGLTAIPAATLAGAGRSLAPLPQTPRSYDGTFWMFVHANGGWDPTLLCDPKGRLGEDDPDPMNMYMQDEILEAGPFKFAPIGYNQVFFEKYQQQLLVINGMDMQTNGHDSGTRHAWSGRLIEGFPSLAAMIAGYYGPELPMSYLSFGGYDLTAGLVARTRSGNVNALSRIAYPDRIDPEDANSIYHSVKARELIQQAHDGRRATQELSTMLPQEQHAMNRYFTSTDGSNELRLLQQYLPEELASDNPIRRQAQVALAAHKAGISIAANINYGGFDTHGDHDNRHIPRMQTLLEGIDAIWEEAEALDVAQNLVVVVGSDFGRTPGYNANNGKDHWSVSSMMLMGKGIAGNRLIGETTHRHQPFNVDPNSLQVSDNGIRVEPQHVHHELRRMAGLLDTDLATMFPLVPTDELSTLLTG